VLRVEVRTVKPESAVSTGACAVAGAEGAGSWLAVATLYLRCTSAIWGDRHCSASALLYSVTHYSTVYSRCQAPATICTSHVHCRWSKSGAG